MFLAKAPTRSNKIFYIKLKEPNNSYPFTKLTPLNIGNPQALKQLPLTFPREVIGSLYSGVSSNMDAIKRADTYKKELKSIGFIVG